MLYSISDIKISVQTEGSRAGCLACFIKFSGCNTNCSICDTEWGNFKRMDAKSIVRTIDDLKAKLKINHYTDLPIVFTGGEPALQLDKELCSFLHMHGFRDQQIETNGSIDIDVSVLSFLTHITMAPKQRLSDTKLEACSDIVFLYPFMSYIGDMKDWIKKYFMASFWLQPVIRLDDPDQTTLNENTAIIKLAGLENDYPFRFKLGRRTHLG